jgi:hypothetical protein
MSHVSAFVGYDDAAELGLVVIAMFAVLLLAGLYLIISLFEKAVRRVPFLGPPVADAVDYVTRWARGAMMGTLHGALWAAGKFARGLAIMGQGIWLAFKDCLDVMGGSIEHIVNVIIPRVQKQDRAFTVSRASETLRTSLEWTNKVRSDAWSWVMQARQYTRQQVASAESRLNTTIRVTATRLYDLLGQAKAQLTARIEQAQARADRQFSQVTAELGKAETSLRAQMAADLTTAETGIRASLRTAETYAEQQAARAQAGAIAAVDGAVAAVEHASWPPVTAMIGELRKAAGTDFPQLLPLLALVPTVAPSTAPAAVAAADAVLPPILRLMTDCVVPNCRDLGPLRNLLHTISGDVFLAALLAWVIYCIEDPAGAAQDTVTVADPVVSPVASALIGLVGGL